MSLNRPISRKTYLGDTLIKQSIAVKERSSTQLVWQFLTGKTGDYGSMPNIPLDLSDVDIVKLVYSTINETPTRLETIYGTVTNASEGEVTVQFTPTNTIEVNDFYFDLTLEKTNGNIIVADANGFLEVQGRAGATGGGSLQTANIIDILSCDQSPYQITYEEAGSTFVIPATLSCGTFIFLMPDADVDYRGSTYYFESSGNNIIEIRAGSSDFIEGSSVGGAFKSAVLIGGLWVNSEDYNSMALHLIDDHNWRIPGPRFKWSTTV